MNMNKFFGYFNNAITGGGIFLLQGNNGTVKETVDQI